MNTLNLLLTAVPVNWTRMKRTYPTNRFPSSKQLSRQKILRRPLCKRHPKQRWRYATKLEGGHCRWDPFTSVATSNPKRVQRCRMTSLRLTAMSTRKILGGLRHPSSVSTLSTNIPRASASGNFFPFPL